MKTAEHFSLETLRQAAHHLAELSNGAASYEECLERIHSRGLDAARREVLAWTRDVELALAHRARGAERTIAEAEIAADRRRRDDE